MSGMDKITGKAIGTEEHIVQSIGDILTTPLGSCLMRHEYGSDLFKLVDAPVTRSLPLLLIAATAAPIRRWEDRVRLTKVQVNNLTAGGRPELTIIGRRTDVPGAPPFSMSLAL